jgi:hypothetical protein
MDAAEDLSSLLHAVTDDPAVAVRANRCQCVDRALKAIEGVVLAGNDHVKGLVIFIFTNFAFSHTKSLSRVAAFAAVSAFFFASESTVIAVSNMPRQLLESRDRPWK